MATGGLQDSNRGNASDFIGECAVTRSCEPCMKTNIAKEATVFCKDCNEYLCETCKNPHLVYKPGKHHMTSIQNNESSTVIVDMKGMDKCSEHGKGFKFFCEDHSKLCCTTCVIAHRKCEKWDEITSISRQKRAELHGLKQSLLKLKSDTDAIVADCNQTEKELNSSVADVSKDIDEMRDRLIKLFEAAKQELLSKANVLKSEEVKKLGQIQSVCTQVIEEINQLLTMCSAIAEQGTPQQKYIFSKQIEEKYKTIESKINEQQMTPVSSKLTLSYTGELSSLLEMGKQFVELNLERTVPASLPPDLPPSLPPRNKPTASVPEKTEMNMYENRKPANGFSGKWEVNRSELELFEVIETGCFGTVHRCTWKGRVVSAKILREGALSEDSLLEEAKTMTQLSHPNLVQLLGVVTKSKPLIIVTELMQNGNLLTYLKRHKSRLLDKVSTLVDMCSQVCSGMEYLESRSFIHRDLAARYCLVGDNETIKVADFSLARYVIDDEYTASKDTKFPVKWSPPEVFDSTRFSSKSDVWAFGVLMWEIFTGGEMPFHGISNAYVVDFVCTNNGRLAKPQGCPQKIYTIMMDCWHKDPEQRPAFAQLSRTLQSLIED